MISTWWGWPSLIQREVQSHLLRGSSSSSSCRFSVLARSLIKKRRVKIVKMVRKRTSLGRVDLTGWSSSSSNKLFMSQWLPSLKSSPVYAPKSKPSMRSKRRLKSIT